MRENLLKKQPTWGLRRAQGTGQKSVTPATLTKVIFVLLTMFLLPSAAWGQGNDYISSTFSGINLGQGQGEGSGPISYNSATATTSTTDASTPRITQGSTATGWDVKNLSSYYSICTGANNATSSETNFVFHPIDVGQANTITFTLESQFGINGKFVKAEIIYNYSYIKSITADANKKAGSEIISLVNSNVSFTCSESGTAEEATGTITANASDYSNMVFDNNNIDLSFTVTTAAVQSGIPSFTISEIRLYFEDVTEQPFNIWVNGTSLTGQNITTFLDGKLGYTQPDGNKPAILHLKGTTAIQSIYTTLENLEIHLSGENKITPSSQVANGICSSQSRDEGALTFTAEEGGSLTIATGVSVIRGFGKCTGNLETHAPYQVTNWGTPSGSYYYLLDNHRDNDNDTTSIKWLRITETQTYPLWVTDKQATASNKGNVLGDGKVSFTPAEGTTPAKLILNNATIESKYGIDWTGDGNFTIQFSGNNIINSYFGGGVSGNVGVCINGYSSSNLTITAANDASSLTLKPDYKPESVNNKKAISGFGSVSLDEDWGMYYTDNYSAATATSLTAGEEVVICKGQPYGFSVGGVLVTSKNMNNILGDKVSFTPATVVVDNPGASTPATLTLDGATISGNIESGITPLAVYLKGSSTITPSNTSDAPFQYTGTESTATLTFQSSEADDGELTLSGNVSETGTNPNIKLSSGGYTYSNTLGTGASGTTFGYWLINYPDSKKHIFYNTHYGITVNNYEVTKNNKDNITALSGGSDFTYSPKDNILTIPTNISDGEIKSHRAELNVQIAGDCTAKFIQFELKADEFGTPETKILNIDRSSTSIPGKNTLTIDTGTDSSDPAISGFTTVNISENLHFEYPENAAAASVQSYPKVVLSDVVVYDLWVEGQQVTSRNKDDVKGENANPNNPPVTPSVVFNPDNSTLNLTNANIIVTTGNESLSGVVSGVVSGLENLTVKFEGSNSIGKSGDGTFYGFSALDGKTCNIAFTATAGGSCYIEADTENAIHGFNKVTYNDGLAAYINDGFNIAPVTLGKPEFIGVFDDETGKLLSVKVKCIASIPDDQLDTPDPVDILSYDLIYTLDGGEETAYTGPITISGPCTLTAKTIVGNTSSDVATGKYFGAKKDAFTMAIGESLADLDWCTPTFNAETEYIICKFISESNVFNYDVDNSSEAISAKATGTGTVNVELSYNDAMVTQILNGEKPITFTINVGEGLSSVFEGSNDYGGLYNDSDTPYALPEGTTAYLITGISEDGTSVTTEPINYIPAHTAILLQKGEGAKAITKVEYKGELTETTNNKFYYSDPNSPATAPTTRSWYVIYNNQFVKVTGGTQVKGGKCYLDLGTTAGTRGFYNIGGGEGTTSLREVKTDGVNNEKWTDGEWYTLQGQRVAKPAKGLYILNGKKVVVK